MRSDFTDAITIRVKDKYFKVPRDLLTTTSVFFDEELNYSTPKKFFIVIDDVNAELFNTYINVLFESSFRRNFKIRRRNASSPASGTANIEFLLRLWKLSHRFNNFDVCLLTEEALIKEYFAKFTAQRWEIAYVRSTKARLRQILLALQRCYTLCKDESIPFAKEFVAACAKCPGQVVATCFDHLDPGFRAAVVNLFAIRVPDPEAAQRKRAREDDSELKASKKRRC